MHRASSQTLRLYARGFVADKVDVIVAITTPAAQVAMGETKDIPIIFSAVTDPRSGRGCFRP